MITSALPLPAGSIEEPFQALLYWTRSLHPQWPFSGLMRRSRSGTIAKVYAETFDEIEANAKLNRCQLIEVSSAAELREIERQGCN